MKVDPVSTAQSWKYIVESCNRIQDPTLRRSYLAVLKQRAIEEWGYCPDDTGIRAKEYSADDLPPLERFMYDKLQAAKDYGVWERDEELEKENLAFMKNWIDQGYTFWDLPPEQQNDTTRELYFKALKKWTDEQKIAIKTLDNRQ